MKRAIAGSVVMWLTLNPAAQGQVAGPPALQDSARARVLAGMSTTNRDTAVVFFDEAIAFARNAVKRDPGSAEAHHLLAAALGGRLEHHGLRTKARMAAEVKLEAETALALDPHHAGAHHILGRIHAGAMRLNPLKRAIARAVLGASALDGASWEVAEAHFQKARELEPDNASHAMELGALYLDTGREEEAREVLAIAVERAPGDPPTNPAVARARELLARAGPAGD